MCLSLSNTRKDLSPSRRHTSRSGRQGLCTQNLCYSLKTRWCSRDLWFPGVISRSNKVCLRLILMKDCFHSLAGLFNLTPCYFPLAFDAAGGLLWGFPGLSSTTNERKAGKSSKLLDKNKRQLKSVIWYLPSGFQRLLRSSGRRVKWKFIGF